MSNSPAPLRIVGIGGTTKAGSSTEKALVACLAAAEKLGVQIEVIAGTRLAALPLYSPEESTRTFEQQQFVASVRDADGLILASHSDA